MIATGRSLIDAISNFCMCPETNGEHNVDTTRMEVSLGKDHAHKWVC